MRCPSCDAILEDWELEQDMCDTCHFFVQEAIIEGVCACLK